MFNLRKIKNWTHSRIVDDEKELQIYQYFIDQFENIDKKIDEYISEMGDEDTRLFVKYNGKMVPVNNLKFMSEALINDPTIDSQNRVYQSAELHRLYLLELKKIKEIIISLSITNKDNIYLSYINTCISILNKLLQEYSYLLAVQRSGIYLIDNYGDLNAGKKIKKLKDNIEIRSNEIKCRLTLDDLERKK